MSGELEAAGAAVTAGLAAGALEGRESRLPVHGPCANCGAQTVGNYCHACGQAAHVHRTLGHMLEEFLHGIWHFDTKAWRTLPLLIFRPGTLTRDYVYGKRARYISPLALFLLTIFLMFFAFSWIKAPWNEPPTGQTLAQARSERTEVRTDLAKASADMAIAQTRLDRADAAEAEARLAADGVRLERALREVEGARIQHAQAQTALSALEKDNAALEALLTRSDRYGEALSNAKPKLIQRAQEAEAASEGVKAAGLRALLERLERQEASVASGAALIKDIPAADIAINGESLNIDALGAGEASPSSFFEEIKRAEEAGKIKVNTGNKVWNKKIHAKLANPELGLYKIQNTAYKYSFLLVPISLPFIWLMFAWKRDVTLFDHTVFILNALSFVSLLLIVLLGLGALPFNVEIFIGLLACIGIPVHTFFHLKGAYALGWIGAICRTLYLLIAAAFCLSVFVSTIVIMGLAG